MLIYNCIVNFLFQAGLDGHMLGIADEDGWVQILDSRRTGSRSLIKGIHDRYIIIYCTHYLLTLYSSWLKPYYIILNTMLRCTHGYGVKSNFQLSCKITRCHHMQSHGYRGHHVECRTWSHGNSV